jgi:hypothetical protein
MSLCSAVGHCLAPFPHPNFERLPLCFCQRTLRFQTLKRYLVAETVATARHSSLQAKFLLSPSLSWLCASKHISQPCSWLIWTESTANIWRSGLLCCSPVVGRLQGAHIARSRAGEPATNFFGGAASVLAAPKPALWLWVMLPMPSLRILARFRPEPWRTSLWRDPPARDFPRHDPSAPGKICAGNSDVSVASLGRPASPSALAGHTCAGNRRPTD